MEARNNSNVSYASVSKAPSSKFIQCKDTQTQTVGVAVQTVEKLVVEKAQSKSSRSKRNQNTSTASSQVTTKSSDSVQLQSKAPSSPNQRRNKSPSKVISDRLPKGSNDQNKQYNRSDCLHDDMEAEDSYAESNAN